MAEEVQQMIEHVRRVIRKPSVTIDENTRLVSSGLVDSMALVDLLLKLEDITHMRIPPGKVQPKDMDTIALMFATAQRVGRPRK
jgi:acyl carrier protein